MFVPPRFCNTTIRVQYDVGPHFAAIIASMISDGIANGILFEFVPRLFQVIDEAPVCFNFFLKAFASQISMFPRNEMKKCFFKMRRMTLHQDSEHEKVVEHSVKIHSYSSGNQRNLWKMYEIMKVRPQNGSKTLFFSFFINSIKLSYMAGNSIFWSLS